ncbi:unnamed protein product [Vicia faba]|uniref:Uncharacterized protein n=1 Tax=Vicia faba TaxID=3906 RepID=A0AAV0YF75_VICFA|nr:unnamed protein product [Vicia faba]
MVVKGGGSNRKDLNSNIEFKPKRTLESLFTSGRNTDPPLSSPTTTFLLSLSTTTKEKSLNHNNSGGAVYPVQRQWVSEISGGRSRRGPDRDSR